MKRKKPELVVGYVKADGKSKEVNSSQIDKQIKQIQSFCGKNNFTLGPVYTDSHKPNCRCDGTDMGKVISRLSSSCGFVSYIVCSDLGKIARTNLDLMVVSQLIKKAGFKLLTADGKYPPKRKSRKIAVEPTQEVVGETTGETTDDKVDKTIKKVINNLEVKAE